MKQDREPTAACQRLQQWATSFEPYGLTKFSKFQVILKLRQRNFAGDKLEGSCRECSDCLHTDSSGILTSRVVTIWMASQEQSALVAETLLSLARQLAALPPYSNFSAL